MHQTSMLYRILGEIGKQSTPVALLEALPAKALICEDDTSPLAFTLLRHVREKHIRLIPKLTLLV
jgi:hypothetical protein